MEGKKTPKTPGVRFTMYIPPELNEQIEFLRYKEKISKNKIILAGAGEHVTKLLKKYPEYKEGKNV